MPAPAHPAGASGPGALSRRTDGGPAQKLSKLSNAAYGEQATYQSDQKGAPMAQTPGPSAQPGPPPSAFAQIMKTIGAQQAQPAQNPDMSANAPTQRPDEPVTQGANSGPGASAQSLGIDPTQLAAKDVAKLRDYLPFLEFQANMPGTDPQARQFVRYVKGLQDSDVRPTQSTSPADRQSAPEGTGRPNPVQVR